MTANIQSVSVTRRNLFRERLQLCREVRAAECWGAKLHVQLLRSSGQV